ncbi:MAG: fibronectin type III-like domain-contianing protein, partial [Bacteroidales bacterium]|nr:fibronectin type III-like domain-contianing protein [Bacteroidales bacterium]
YSDFNIEKSRDGFTVTLCVSNKGEMAGKEVVQLYVAAPASDLVKPVKELKSFAKTGIIEPGQSELVTMKVKTEDLASFNSELSAWVVDKGDYQVLVGASSADIRGTLPFRVKRAVKKEVNNVMNPLEPINIIR